MGIERDAGIGTVGPAGKPALGRSQRWLLLVLCGAELLVGIDFAIINIALPTIQQDLGFTQDGLQWVVTALAVPFGGLLLVCGRAADLFGRRRMLLAGLSTLTVSSLLAGLATAPWMLVAMRAAQGIGSAMIAPAALSLITTRFREGPERTHALGVAGAVLPFGFIAGLVLGGALAELSWRLTMLVNVPAGLLILVAAIRFVPESRSASATGRLDLPGALTSTAALTAVVFAISRAESAGWADAATLLGFLTAALCGVAFVFTEARSAAPLAPLHMLRSRSTWGPNVPGIATFAGAVGTIFTLSLYLQHVLHYTPLGTGIAFVVMGVSSLLAGQTAPRLLISFGARITLAAGLSAQAGGTALLCLLNMDGASLAVLLPAIAITGFGHITSVVAFRTSATAQVPDHQQGLATALTNVAQQIGASLGATVFTAVATARADTLLRTGTAAAESTVSGTRYAMLAGVTILLAAALFTLLAVPRRG